MQVLWIFSIKYVIWVSVFFSFIREGLSLWKSLRPTVTGIPQIYPFARYSMTHRSLFANGFH